MRNSKVKLRNYVLDFNIQRSFYVYNTFYWLATICQFENSVPNWEFQHWILEWTPFSQIFPTMMLLENPRIEEFDVKSKNKAFSLLNWEFYYRIKAESNIWSIWPVWDNSQWQRCAHQSITIFQFEKFSVELRHYVKKQPPAVLYKKSCFKNLLHAWNFHKKRLQRKCFPVNIGNLLRKSIL